MARPHLHAAACIAVLLLAGCGGRGRPDDASMVVRQGPDGARMAVRPGRDPNAAYIQATALKAKGDCENAAALLRPVAALGPGYENAQTVLGECLLTRPADSADGVTWLTRAADAGWPEAQAALAGHYGLSAEPRNGPEAAYWLALYDANPGKARIGFRPVDESLLQSLRANLDDEEKAAGLRRAATWERKLWLPPPSADGPDGPGPDGPGLRPERRERGPGPF